MILHTKIYESPAVREKEILRYAGCAEADGATSALMADCLAEALGALTYKVCWREMNVDFQDGVCDFDTFSVFSHQLTRNLEGCTSVMLFAATVGVGMDRLIAKYSRIAPSRALMMQAIGAERIEALCDAFVTDWSAENARNLRPRFSPGYGDLSLDVQKEIITLLDTPRQIGLSLNDSLLMSPTKSVTAFAGITNMRQL